MKILISVSHPAHVHLFKNIIWKLLERNHSVLIAARNKDVTLDLLEKFNFNYILISNAKPTPLSLISETVIRIKKFFFLIKNYKPDLCLSQMDPSMAFASKLLGVPYICLADTEHATATIHFALPFTETVLTPSCFRKKLGIKQISYSGYKELAYLNPKYFTPNPSVLNELGLSKNNPFIIVRFVSWNASHDVGQSGIINKIDLIKSLEIYGRILISSEGVLPKDLKPYQIQISPEKLHDVLSYAALYIGEGATMASEAAILGTPSILVSSLIGTMGNFIELENEYGLLYTFKNEMDAIKKAESLLKIPNLKTSWIDKRDQLLKDKIDLTSLMIWLIENYPISIDLIKKNPEIQDQFKNIGPYCDLCKESQ